jgi:hypothetical protein
MYQGLQGKSAVHTLLFICLISTMFVTILARRCRRYSGPTTILALGQNRSPNSARCRRRFRPGSGASPLCYLGRHQFNQVQPWCWNLEFILWYLENLVFALFCRTIPSIIYEVIYQTSNGNCCANSLISLNCFVKFRGSSWVKGSF